MPLAIVARTPSNAEVRWLETVPVAIVEPECAVHVQEQSESERIASDPVDLPYAVASGKRAVPRRP